MPALQAQIDTLTQQRDDLEKEIMKMIDRREMALKKKSDATTDDEQAFYAEALSFFVGKHIQAIDKKNEVNKQLKKLSQELTCLSG